MITIRTPAEVRAYEEAHPDWVSDKPKRLEDAERRRRAREGGDGPQA